MMKPIKSLLNCIVSLLISCGVSTSAAAEEPIRPIPQHVAFDRAKALIGKRLFFDPILSKDRTTSCSSCHDLYHGGADTRPVSLGVGRKEGNIQSPTVLNARFNFKLFWNGRAADLLEQASGPIHNPSELAMKKEAVEKRINASPVYRPLFESVYGPGPFTFEQILEVIVEFEKALVTPNSRFDRYLRNELILTPQEKEGYLAFKKLGCITCHNGINVGGNSFQRMGTIIPYKYDARYPDLYDTKRDELYKNVFKVPTLRNIALTAPYFHDASAPDLHKAIETMSFHNLGFIIKKKDIDAIVAFLKTLTGDTPDILKEEP